jgi:hypothetical protein
VFCHLDLTDLFVAIEDDAVQHLQKGEKVVRQFKGISGRLLGFNGSFRDVFKAEGRHIKVDLQVKGLLAVEHERWHLALDEGGVHFLAEIA